MIPAERRGSSGGLALSLAFALTGLSAEEVPSGGAVAKQFAALDRNRDGVLTRDEFGDHADLFAKIDGDRNGHIALDEAMRFARTAKAAASPAAVEGDTAIKAIRRRIADRTFPSLFRAWSPITNLPQEDPIRRMARHDLVFRGSTSFGLRWDRSPAGLAEGFESGSIAAARALRRRLLSINPNCLLLAEVRYRDAHSRFLPPDHPWWKRDAEGRRMEGWEEGKFLLLDFSNPVFRAHVAARAKALVASGAVDGVMLDWWRDDEHRLELVKAVRHAIGEEALILVNANDRTTPRTAPYINGYFMECWRSKTAEDWKRIAETLRWAEEHLRQPPVNCVETWYHRSRQDLDRMRATTCLTLTHSNGYCLFSDPNGLPSPDHRHDWYPFWEKRLGKPIAAGTINDDGSARREFEHGTAFYNPMGSAPKSITFLEPRRSLAHGTVGTEHTVKGLDGDIFLKIAKRTDDRRDQASDPRRDEFQKRFLRFSDLATAELAKDITPFVDRNNADPATHHMPFFEDAHAVRALAVAYDMYGKRAYLDACRRWSDRIIAYQQKMIPSGAYYMNHSRAPGKDSGQWNVADSGSIGMGVLATAVRCTDAAEKARYLASVKSFASLVLENYVGPGGGVTNGLWPAYSGEWWCSTATFGTLAFLLHEETGEERYLRVARGALDWMLRQDFRQVQPITFQQRPSGIIFYCFELYVAGLKHLEPGGPKYERAIEQIGRALDWMAENQKSRGADVPDYLERNVDMAALPYLMYAFARQIPRFRKQTGAADGELRYIGSLLLDRGEPNVSRLMVWEVMTWGMLSYAERLKPGALCRGSRRSDPSTTGR